MKTKFINIWYKMRASYWFIPSLMLIIASCLSLLLIYIDVFLAKHGWIDSLNRFYPNKPEGARALLSTVAGSMITVAGVVFSITMVALTLASSQFGPRLLVNFMRDRGNQLVLGTFISTFVYCLLVLRTIRSGENTLFVPQVAVTFALIMTIASIIVLIYFIHHASTSIQASNVIANVGDDLERSIERLFPEKIDTDKSDKWSNLRILGDIPLNFEKEVGILPAPRTGYIQAIDYNGLIKTSTDREIIIKLKRRPGHYVIQQSKLAEVWPLEKVNEELLKTITGRFIIGKDRTDEQDPEFAFDQLVEIAMRALSPGINDPFTAIMCIDRLSSALCKLAQREFPSNYLYNNDNKLCVITDPVTFSEITDTAFNQIRQYGRSSAAVTIRLLEVIGEIAAYIKRDEDRAALMRHADMIMRGSKGGLPEELDRKDVEEIYSAVVNTIEGKLGKA
jgi:uncharacterized membrane protein